MVSSSGLIRCPRCQLIYYEEVMEPFDPVCEGCRPVWHMPIWANWIAGDTEGRFGYKDVTTGTWQIYDFMFPFPFRRALCPN